MSTYRIPGPWNHEAFSLFRIPGPWNHEIFAQFAQKRIFDALPNVNDLTCKFKEIDVPDEFVSNLIQAILDWSKHALNGIPDEHKQTALRHMKITSTGFGVMNRITSPAIRNGILPVITLDFLLHAVDPLHPASPSPRAFLRPFSSTKHKNVQSSLYFYSFFKPSSALSQEHGLAPNSTQCLGRPRRTRRNITTTDTRRGNDSGRNEEKVSDCLKHVEQQFKARRHRDVQHDSGGFHAESDERGNLLVEQSFITHVFQGKMVMTLDAFVDLALLWVSFRFAWTDLTENSQAHQEDSSITRSEVAAILNDPNVDGICAALAVAAAVSPILLLSTQNYANATYNPSTSVFDASYWFAGGNMSRVQLEQPLGQIERVCWIALLRLSAQTISAAEALKFIFDSKDVQSIIKKKPSEDQLKILEYAGDQPGYEFDEADPDDAYDQEISRLAEEERAREEKEKKEQEAHAEKERRKAAKAQAAKEKAEAKRLREEEERNGAEGLEPPSGKRKLRTLPVKVKPVEVSVPVIRRAKSRATKRPAVLPAAAPVNKNAYIHILDGGLGDIPEHISLAKIKPLNLTASRPMDPEPLVLRLHVPKGVRGCSYERTFKYHMFQKFVPQASDRQMIESMLQSQPTARPLFLEDSARDPNPRLQASEKQSILYEPPPPFSWETLQQFRDPDALCPIQDMGLKGSKGDQCLVAGPLNALLPKEGRPVLNAVHHPLPHQQLPLPPGLSYFCSLAAAMTFLQNHQHLPGVPSPWGDRRWGLCATALARSPTHQDIAATEITILTGAKMVAIGVPRAGEFGTTNYRADPGSRFSFMDWEYVQEDAQIDVYRWEVFVLEPNMVFYMRAGTPHFIISLEDTIAYGLHSINGAQIQPAIFTVLHNLVTEGFHANAEHCAIQWLLVHHTTTWVVRFIQYELLLNKVGRPETPMHYPNIGTPEGLLDIMTLQSYVVLYPALLLEPYKNMPATKSMMGTASSMTAERYQEYDLALYSCVSLQRWIDYHMFVVGTNQAHNQVSGTISFQSLLKESIVNMASCLVCYRAAWINKVRETDAFTTGFSVSTFTQQLRRAMAAYEYRSEQVSGLFPESSSQAVLPEDGYLTTAFDAELNGEKGDSSHTHFMPWDLQSRPMPFSLRAEAGPANSKRLATEDKRLHPSKRLRTLDP
ncbi:hypothetical protein R3P38DRAFT_2805807 [Favolaschia claudopus]|uniref:JmjC domain-containing protein n=1 Tax=Favolaschia claudopus TaxID=2862362 RepID=A0AAV9ZLK3_9AGAR